MVSRGYCRILGLAVVQFAKALESYIDETPVAKQTLGCNTHHQAERNIHDDIFELGKSSHEDPVGRSRNKVTNGDSPVSKTHLSSSSWPRKKLKTTDEEGVGNHKLKDYPKKKSKPLSEERKVEIATNLAMYQNSLDPMKVEGELMKHWLGDLMENKELLEQYSKVPEQDSVSSILTRLHIFQRDMRKVVRTRFRTWGSVGGYIFEPAGDTKTEKPDQERPAEAQKLTEEEVAKNLPDSEKPAVQGQQGAQPQLSYDALGVVHNHLMKTWFEDLSHILHSVKFPSHDDYSNTTWEEVRVIKVAFEKTMFQAIQFLRKFELIEKKQFDELFSKSDILDCIGIHLVDLLQVVKYETYNPLAFIPDMEFLVDNWKTEYLKAILEDLERTQITHIIGVALACTVKLHKLFGQPGRKTEWSNDIYNSILDEKILQKLNKGDSGISVASDIKPNVENKHLEDSVKKLINIFQEPDLNPGWQVPINDLPRNQMSRLKTEYFLIYHILSFIETYNSKYLRSLFGISQEVDYSIFLKQLEIFKQGFKLKGIIQQGQTYIEIMSSEYTSLYTFSKEFARIQMNQTRKQHRSISEAYKKMENEFEFFSKNDAKTKFWLHGNGFSSKIIESFNNRAKSWNEGMRIERSRRNNLILGHYSWRERQEYIFLKLPMQYFFCWEKRCKYLSKELLNIWDPECFYL